MHLNNLINECKKYYSIKDIKIMSRKKYIFDYKFINKYPIQSVLVSLYGFMSPYNIL